MSLAPGVRVGPYEITAKLGAGGMGEVYRARDSRLHRDVAIKVLPTAFATDGERRARFEREAKAIAALSHPNIVSIFDTGQHDDQLLVVMELLEGETLRARVAAGALAVRKAIEIGVQIARGLAAAHEKGLVHRDLKPENVWVLPDGRVKILDFGLAKAVGSAVAAAAGSLAGAETVAATDPGTVLGTVGYMAPEQVRGQATDARSDLFALGAVLYELLTGQRAFQRGTPAETMTAILREEPADLTSDGRADLSPALERIVRHCLEKNPAERFQSASDVAFALEGLAGSGVSPRSSERVDGRPGSTGRRVPARSLAVAVLTTATVVSAAFFAWGRWTADYAPFSTDLDGGVLGGPALAIGPRVSPSGQSVAFQAMVDGNTQVAVMNLASGAWRVLTRDQGLGVIEDLAWSRDGARIFYARYLDQPRGIFSVSDQGGDVRLVLAGAMTPRSLPDGSLLVIKLNESGAQEVFRYWPEQGGRLTSLGVVTKSDALSALRVFPDGREAVFLGRPLGGDNAQDHLYAVDVESGAVRRLAPSIAMPRSLYWFPLGTSADAVLFDLPAGGLHRIVAVPRDGSAGVQSVITLTEMPGFLDVGADGELYLDQQNRSPEIVRYSPSERRVSRTRLPGQWEYRPVLPLPDGRMLVPTFVGGKTRVVALVSGSDTGAFVQTDEETNWPMALVGSDHVAISLGGGAGSRIAIVTAREGRIVRRLSQVDAAHVAGFAGSPDGATLFYVSRASGTGQIWAVATDNASAPRLLRAGDAVAVEPGGRYLIVQVNEGVSSRLVRVPVAGGAEQPLRVKDDVPLASSSFMALGPSAVGSDGRIAVRVVPPDSWNWPIGVFDPRTGRMELIPDREADMLAPAWTPDGDIVALAHVTRSSIWRFRPLAR